MKKSKSDDSDCGGNREYDYISLEDFYSAELSLKNKTTFKSLTQNEIVVLRHYARKVGLIKDIVDHCDRLEVLRCLFYHCEQKRDWIDHARSLEKELKK